MQRSAIAADKSAGGSERSQLSRSENSACFSALPVTVKRCSFLAHHQVDAALARDHLFEPEPPGLSDTIGKRGGHIDREGHGVARQHRIGEVDEVLDGAVEGERHEAPLLRQRHRAAADLVHAEEVIASTASAREWRDREIAA